MCVRGIEKDVEGCGIPRGHMFDQRILLCFEMCWRASLA